MIISLLFILINDNHEIKILKTIKMNKLIIIIASINVVETCGWKKEVRTSGRNLDGELGVAEDGKHGGDAGDDVRQNDGGAGVSLSLESGEDEYSGTDDGADAEPHKVPPVERFLHLVLAPSRQLHDLCVFRGPGREPAHEPGRRLLERFCVISPTLKRLLRKKIILRATGSLPDPFSATVRLPHSDSTLKRSAKENSEHEISKTKQNQTNLINGERWRIFLIRQKFQKTEHKTTRFFAASLFRAKTKTLSPSPSPSPFSQRSIYNFN